MGAFNDAAGRDLIRRALLDSLVCPKCHKANRPLVTDIHIDEHGHAACDGCGNYDCVQAFIPKDRA